MSRAICITRGSRDRSGADATHAWVEAYLPSLGWVGFDPTNNIMAGERHIRAAVGRDYADVPPTRGTFKGEADSELVHRGRGRADPGAGAARGFPASGAADELAAADAFDAGAALSPAAATAAMTKRRKRDVGRHA